MADLAHKAILPILPIPCRVPPYHLWKHTQQDIYCNHVIRFAWQMSDVWHSKLGTLWPWNYNQPITNNNDVYTESNQCTISFLSLPVCHRYCPQTKHTQTIPIYCFNQLSRLSVELRIDVSSIFRKAVCTKHKLPCEVILWWFFCFNNITSNLCSPEGKTW